MHLKQEPLSSHLEGDPLVPAAITNVNSTLEKLQSWYLPGTTRDAPAKVTKGRPLSSSKV